MWNIGFLNKLVQGVKRSPLDVEWFLELLSLMMITPQKHCKYALNQLYAVSIQLKLIFYIFPLKILNY